MTTWNERKQQYNEHYFTTYSGHITAEGVPSVSTEKATECARILYNFFTPTSVLDCGCATGWLIHGFLNLDKGVKVAGFDISEFAIQHTYEDLREKVISLDISDVPLPYADGEFDLVLGFDILEHLQDYEAISNAVNEMCRISNRWIFLRQPMTAFCGFDDIGSIHQWLVGLNPLPHRARLALVGVAKEINPAFPVSNAMEHPNEHARPFWVELFSFFGYKERQLAEEMYQMPNAIHIHSFDALVLEKT